MRVTTLELPARWSRCDEALHQVDHLLSHGPTDLVLLPEASLSGYVSPEGDFDLTPFAEDLQGPTARALSSLAVKHRTHLIGPLVERAGAQCFNSMLGFGPTGLQVLHYRKRHPWFPEAWATAGTEPLPVLEVAGHRFCLAVCFDLHFLRAESEAQLKAVDTLLFSSAWVDDQSPVRPAMLGALARDYSINVVNANWGPGAPRVFGQGGSMIIDPKGAPVGSGTVRLDATL